ncbi:hypothetical protein NKJ72_20420 [Mesorhizobium sp. M0045]|uniref:hypothetical protein n=1 Tax=Mesorhizobium sp. M0045 TaxID=2956857 RepID=UPI00333B6D63
MSVPLPTELSSIWITGGLATFMGTLALASCPTLLANAVSAERQGRVMGNNQALQVGGGIAECGDRRCACRNVYSPAADRIRPAPHRCRFSLLASMHQLRFDVPENPSN